MQGVTQNKKASSSDSDHVCVFFRAEMSLHKWERILMLCRKPHQWDAVAYCRWFHPFRSSLLAFLLIWVDLAAVSFKSSQYFCYQNQKTHDFMRSAHKLLTLNN